MFGGSRSSTNHHCQLEPIQISFVAAERTGHGVALDDRQPSAIPCEPPGFSAPDSPGRFNWPEWVDLVCWTGPASQPSGGDIPATATTAYDAWLSPSRVAEVVAGNDRRVTTTNYDTASRATGSEVTTPGVADVARQDFWQDR